MQNTRSGPRKYSRLSEKSVDACLAAIDNFNRVSGIYRKETTLILLSNAWELLAKAVLLKNKKSIYIKGDSSDSISCEKAINKLYDLQQLEINQVELVQQIISLRNQCVHDLLPTIPEAIQHHLLFYGCKFFKELAIKNFPKIDKRLSRNYLSLSFDQLTTYSNEVQKMISKLRKGTDEDRNLIWLLERGVRFVNSHKYLSQQEFETLYRSKKKITPYLEIGRYLTSAEMISVVPVQAPRNYTADITLRKSSKNLKGTLPVTIVKTTIEEDYPYLTSDIASKINKTSNFVAYAMQDLRLKNNKEFHQKIRTSHNSYVQRYNIEALNFLANFVDKNPDYNPHTQKKK